LTPARPFPVNGANVNARLRATTAPRRLPFRPWFALNRDGVRHGIRKAQEKGVPE
jgi:hypothetical protein